MQRLADLLRKLKSRWLLSCDASPQCLDIFKGYEQIRIPIKYTVAGCLSRKLPVSWELLVKSKNLELPLKKAA